mgnify:FL=1
MRSLGQWNRATHLACTLGIAVVIGLGSFHQAEAQSQYDDQIQALEEALEAIKAAVASGEDVNSRITAIERDLAELKVQVGRDPTVPPVEASTLEAASTSPAAPPGAVEPADTPREDMADNAADSVVVSTGAQRGMQGAINPLQENKNYLTGDDLLDESFPGSIPIFGSDWRFAMRGYIKLDAIQDFDYVGNRFEFYTPSIPVEGEPEASFGGRTTVHAKETRFGFDFRKRVTSAKGNEYPLQAFLEFDFFDDREDFRYQPRLRHAYGVIGRLLAGRTWTTSADLSVLAGTIDFDAGDSLYGNRVSQVRWADRLNDNTTWALALEDNRSEISNPLGFEGRNRPETPNLSGYLRWNQGRTHLGLGWDLFSLQWQGGETGPDDTEVGWGLALSGRYLLGTASRNAISGQLTWGKGSAYQVLSYSGVGAGAVLDPTGNIELLQHWQAYLAYNHYWSENLNSSFVFAHADVDTTDYMLEDRIKSVSTVHANLIWFPYKSVSTGVELMWGERENMNGATGEATRFQFMVKYKFN